MIDPDIREVMEHIASPELPNGWADIFDEMFPEQMQNPEVSITTLYMILFDASARMDAMRDRDMEVNVGFVLEDTISMFTRMFLDKMGASA